MAWPNPAVLSSFSRARGFLQTPLVQVKLCAGPNRWALYRGSHHGGVEGWSPLGDQERQQPHSKKHLPRVAGELEPATVRGCCALHSASPGLSSPRKKLPGGRGMAAVRCCSPHREGQSAASRWTNTFWDQGEHFKVFMCSLVNWLLLCWRSCSILPCLREHQPWHPSCPTSQSCRGDAAAASLHVCSCHPLALSAPGCQLLQGTR